MRWIRSSSTLVASTELDEDEGHLPVDSKQATSVLFPPLARCLTRTTLVTDNRLVRSYDDVIALQFLRRHTTRCAIVDYVTQSVGHAVVLNLLFPVGKDGKWDNYQGVLSTTSGTL